VVNIMITVFWSVTSYSVEDEYRQFGMFHA